MWPLLLDMSKIECKRMLRRLELEAYGTMVSALRAQGGLSSEKRKLLQEISSTLNIPQERHRAEIRRAVNDERLATVAYCMTGDDTTDEWALEGRRLVPLMPRTVPQTAYSVIADDEANKASIENEKLPHPASTERKRPLQTAITEQNKNIQYATNEFSASKHSNQCIPDETSLKKRKPNLNMESSTLAQHLIMGPPKISRVQQLYRQKTKALMKQQMKRTHPPPQHITNIQKHRKIDDDKNISIPSQKLQESKPSNSPPVTNTSQIVSGENAQTKLTTIQTPKPATPSNTVKVQQTPVVVNTTDVTSKSIKICPARKVLTATPRTQNQSQKLIIVSNSQGSTTSSILQRTLTIPFVKTISMKNLDKLKVITTSSAVSTSTTSTTNQKPKLLTVHTKMKGNSGKHINIPFIQGVQLQALQNKGAIKMVPLSTTAKTTSKSGGINTTTTSVYIMNSNAISAVTSSNSSPIMTTKPQASTSPQETQKSVYIIKNEEIKPAVINPDNLGQNVLLLNLQPKSDQKSSVLTDILKASGVIPSDEGEVSQEEQDVQDQCDIESQITQLTEIPNREGETENEIVESTDSQIVESIQEPQETEQFENIDEAVADTETEPAIEESNYVILEDGAAEGGDVLMCEMEEDTQKQTSEVLEVMGSLDPETGMYSIQEPTEEIDSVNEIVEQEQDTANYVIEMDSLSSSELDMPALSLN